MAHRSTNPTWQDYPSTATQVTAARLENLEGAVDNSVVVAGDLGGTAGTPTVAKVNGVAVTGTPSSGQVITATSGTAATWQTPASAPPAITPTTGYYITSQFGSGNATIADTNFTTLGNLNFMPLWVPAATYTGIVCVINTAAAAGGTVRLGIYAVGSNGAPGTLVVDAGTVDPTTTGVKTATISQALSANWYYLAYVNQGTAAAQPRGFTSFAWQFPVGASNLVLQTPGSNHIVSTGVTGALASNPALTFQGNSYTQTVILGLVV